ncbi:MAG: acyltransferase family protein [Dehalococcoidia bacterium]
MNKNERQFRPDVEGLRAVAVCLVVLGHAGVPWVEGGYIGVDVFFVLSGFLITALLLRERETAGSTSIVGFYARRARRILPAASLVLIVTVAASYQWLGFLRGEAIATDGKWASLFAMNLHLAREGTQYLNVSAPPSPLQHYWSLAVEEQFYLVWPILFLAVCRFGSPMRARRRLATALLCVMFASFAWSVVQTGSNPAWAFFSPLTRAWELAFGGLLAVAAQPFRRLPKPFVPWLSWAGVVGIALAALTFTRTTPFPGSAAALPVLATGMVLVAGGAAPGCGAERLLRLPPFQFLGRLSFSLYLWHWPILVIAEQRAGHALSLPENLGLVGAAFAFSVITHYALENPVRYARPLARRPAVSIAFGLGLVAGAFFLSNWQLTANSFPRTEVRVAAASAPEVTPFARAPRTDPVEEVLARVAAASSITSLPSDLEPDLASGRTDFAWVEPGVLGCLIDPDKIESPPCVFGDASGSRTLVLLGDSHAAQWIGAFDQIGQRQHWKVVLLAKSGCPAASLTFTMAYGTGANRFFGKEPDCLPWLGNAIARIEEIQPDLLVVANCSGCEFMVDSSGDRISKEAWAEAMRKTLGRVGTAAKTTAILSDIPRWFGPLDCLALHPRSVQSCSKQAEDLANATYNDVDRAVAAETGAQFIDVTPWFCAGVCSPVIGNFLAYTNDSHVTAAYAGSLSEVLEAKLSPLLGEN